jgi:hypothetical protein
MVMAQKILPCILMLHPVQNLKNSIWMDIEDGSALLVLTIGKALSFKDEKEDELMNFFICDPSAVTQNTHHRLIKVFDSIAQEEMNLKMFSETTDNQIDLAVTTVAVIMNVVTTDDETTTTELFPRVSSKSVAVEVEPGKTLNINPDLSIAETH